MLKRHGVRAARMVDRLIQEAGFQVEKCFTVQHADLAREAYNRYGKGQQTAGLNYGDCFRGFCKTDIIRAEPRN